MMALALPPTYLLQTHLSLEELHDLEDQIPMLTYDITEAKLVLGKVTTKQRALFELRSRKLWTEEVVSGTIEVGGVGEGGAANTGTGTPPRKRRKTDDTEEIEVSEVDLKTESDAETHSLTGSPVIRPSQESTQSQDRSSPLRAEYPLSAATTVELQPDIEWGDTVKVVKLDWFTECLAAGHLLPIGDYLVYEGRLPPRTTSAEPKIIKVPY